MEINGKVKMKWEGIVVKCPIYEVIGNVKEKSYFWLNWLNWKGEKKIIRDSTMLSLFKEICGSKIELFLYEPLYTFYINGITFF